MMKWTKGGSIEYFESLTFPSAEMTDVLEILGETRSILCSLFVFSLDKPPLPLGYMCSSLSEPSCSSDFRLLVNMGK